MPELPEVETTRRGIEPHVVGQRVTRAVVRRARLRWPVAEEVASLLPGLEVLSVRRRAKYLLLDTVRGSLIVHLGMSGSLRLVSADQAPGKHDHVDLVLASGQALRLCDPRCFGALLWSESPLQHPLLADLGPEPLLCADLGEHLYQASRGRRQAVKAFIMDNRQVVGVGNIYATEALFMAGIHPERQAGRIARKRYQRLADVIQQVLSRAIACGGTTLKDFVGGDGKPGYFAIELSTYGRAGEPCSRCRRPLSKVQIGQRSSVFCRYCQT